MLVALMMEGKFSGEGLQSLDADEDLMSAMARELVEKAGVGESADQVWRQLDRERARHMASTEAGEKDDGKDLPAPLGQSEHLFQPSIHLVHSAPEHKRKDAPPWPITATAEDPVQLSLFG